MLNNIVIVLVGTKYSGNVGSVARAMHNMGLSHLRLASPKCRMDEEAIRMARSGSGILQSLRKYQSLPSALRGLRLVIGTSGKRGGNRDHSYSTRSLVPVILSHAARHRVGLVFGPEDTGLVDEDLLRCQMLMRIPTQPHGRSINLAQAAMIVSYELFLGHLGFEPARVPNLATIEQTEAMYVQLEAALRDIGFLRDENARHMMFRLRRLLGRAGLESSDVGILRGVARQIAWFGSRSRRS